MPNTDTKEKAFQNEIIAHLASTGYHKRGQAHYHKGECLDVELVLKFIQDTQPKMWEKFKKIYGEKSQEKFVFRLVKEIESKGTINILRNGFKDVGCQFDLFYPKPNNKKNLDLFDKFGKNIFSVVDELEYENVEKPHRVDLVIFVNGLPIITIELKDTFTQGVERAIKQYKEDRDPKQQIFKKCFVHFAMSDEKIFMATKLEGPDTKFLPFNKGLENPIVENNYKTSYLYNDILQINKLSRLISNFIYMERENDQIEETPIFPRFHQLECANNLLSVAKPGENYLVQHSAGSGKTKTIAWLSHGLMNRFDNNDERVYDMIIVVSDRKVIDSQLQKQVKAFEKIKGVVEKIDKDSKQLKEALKTGTNVVVTTIQKFPFVLEEMGDLPKRKYAVIIDEAHSSQTGTTARKMKEVLSVNSLEEAEEEDSEALEDYEEEILEDLKASKNLKNVSFFAFTATPKNKTLEMFGTKDEKGQYHPFHLYSMKQAIEEGFIFDVLKHYVDYDTYFKLIKSIEGDPEYEEKKAKKLLRNFVEKHPVAIDKKTKIMLDHFMGSTIHKIKGKARAMVVTRSRLHAVLYKRAFDRLIKEEGFPIKTLVAFTGMVEHDTQEYTESSMNNLPLKQTIVDAFEKDPYKILIVANKFQTGFDEPLLHTMYVDKQLNGITAVQTLSRINRIMPPDKNDTLIIDFANKPDVIQKAFKPYHETTYLEESTDPHKLYDLQDKLLEFRIFDKTDIGAFVKAYKNRENQSKLHNILNLVVNQFNGKSKKEQVGFKKTLRRYQSIYSFLSQLIPFVDIELEKLFIFNKFLGKKLPTINNPLPYSMLQDVDMDSYKIVKTKEAGIELISDGALQPISSTAGKYSEESQKRLSLIIKDLNDAYGTDFGEEDRIFLGAVKNNLLDNKDFIEKIENNSKENVKAVFDKFFEEELAKLLNKNMRLYKRIVEDDMLRKRLETALLELIYQDYDKIKKKLSVNNSLKKFNKDKPT